MKVKEVLKKIGLVFLYIIGTLFFGFTSVFLFDKHKKDKVNKLEAELEKEKKINELEKKSASDIAADSPHSDIISSNIE